MIIGSGGGGGGDGGALQNSACDVNAWPIANMFTSMWSHGKVQREHPLQVVGTYLDA